MDDDDFDVKTITAVEIDKEIYLLGSDVTAFLRGLSYQFHCTAAEHVEQGERTAALAVGELAIQMEHEADLMDTSCIEAQWMLEDD